MIGDAAIGALAVFTFGALLIICLYHFLKHNRDPKNREITKAVVAGDSSAHTGVRGGSTPGHMK